MKFLVFLLLILHLPVTGQSQNEEIISEVIRQLEIDSTATLTHLITSKEFESETLVVIPEIVEEEPGVAFFDAHLALVDNQTGTIRATYLGSRDWYSDAVRLSNIDIEPKPYRLGSEKTAYGILIDYVGSSRVNPYHATELSLFVREGRQLKRVLKDYRISYLNAETDMNCNSEFEKHSKNLKITNNSGKEYPDLIFTDFIERGYTTEENCEPVTTGTEEKTEVLRYEQGKYQLL